MISSDSKTEMKFEMIQDYLFKFKILKSNLSQSQKLNKTLKQELFKIGSQSNSLLISISSLASKITQLKSTIPQIEKQLNFTKQQYKRMVYKTEKMEIKLRQYEQRRKSFDEMYISKRVKNQTLKQKIEKLQLKISEQRQNQKQIFESYNKQKPIQQLSNRESLKVQSMYLKNLRKNPLDELQILILENEVRIKKYKEQRQQLSRKNNQFKFKITKIQQQIQLIKSYLSQNSCIGDFKQQKQRDQKQNGKINIKRQQQRILKYSSNNNKKQQINQINKKVEQTRINKLSNKLPIHILNCLSSYQNFKSKSILDTLLLKHQQISQQQQNYLLNLQQNYKLINQLSKINTSLQSQIVQQNSKINTFNIKSKKYTDIHTKSLY